MNTKRDIPVDEGTLTAERVDERHIEFVRDHGDGVEHKVRMFTFSHEEIDRLQACSEIAHERIRKERRANVWWRRWLRYLFGKLTSK
jgi:hypothetical protein